MGEKKHFRPRRNFYSPENKESTKPLGDVIDAFVKAQGIHTKLDEVEVVLAWKEVFGEVIDKKTRGIKLQKDGTLVAYLNSGPLKEEFNLNKDKIVQMINAHMKKKVVLRVRIQ